MRPESGHGPLSCHPVARYAALRKTVPDGLFAFFSELPKISSLISCLFAGRNRPCGELIELQA
jgi:hypothetical protein